LAFVQILFFIIAVFCINYEIQLALTHQFVLMDNKIFLFLVNSFEYLFIGFY